MENSNTTEANYQFNKNVDCVTPTQSSSANNCITLSEKSCNFPAVRTETPKRVNITSQEHESPNDGVVNRLNNRKFVGFVTPQSSKSLISRTPGSVLGSAVKKRLNIFDFDHELECNKKSKTDILNEFKDYKVIPKCLYAAGYLQKQLMSSETAPSTIIKNLPSFFGFYKTPSYCKSISRIKIQFEELFKRPSVKSACLEALSDEIFIKSHNDSPDYPKDHICHICFPSEVNQKCSPLLTDEDKLEAAITIFFNAKIEKGVRFDAVNQDINKIAQSVANKYNYYNTSKVSAPRTNEEILSSISNNVANYKANLESNSAYLYYGSTISHRQTEKLDHVLFCKGKEKYLTIEEMLNNLPNINSFCSPIVDLDFDSIFEEYRNHIEALNSEPSFVKLGEKFQLTGLRGGTKRKGFFAQTVILTKLEELKDKDLKTFHHLYQIFADGFLKRSKYEQFEIIDDVTFPRLPTKNMALQQLQNLADKGEILLGQSQYPQKLIIMDPVTAEPKEILVYARKIGFNELREFTLNKHLLKGFMRAKDISEYKTLTRQEILEKLELFGILEDSLLQIELDKLQNLIYKLESSRHIAVWFDHCILGNISHIMFTFQLIYNPVAYKCPPGVSERQVQYEIEHPNTNYIGISRSDTSTERSFCPMRIDDIMTLSNGIHKNGVTFNDKYRLTLGDNPVRCAETSQNKSGHYHCCSLPLHMKEFDNFQELVKVEHQSIDMLRETANKGNFFDLEENIDLNLQKLNSRDYCDANNLNYLNMQEAQKLHESGLRGRQGVPLLLRGNPFTPLSDLNLEDYEVMPVEPLHDIKGVVKKSFAHIPGQSIHIADDAILKSIHSIVHKTGDELYLLKDQHSGEDLAKSLVDINIGLERNFFPDGFDAPCAVCGHIFTLSSKRKCIKCAFVGYFRALAEIQVHGYKNASKRNAHEVLRLHVLVYLLFYFLECIEHVHSRFSMSSIIKSTWFVNVVYYLPLAYELCSLLSIHVGRNEDQFKQVKVMSNNLSNNQYHTPNVLLNAIRRLEANRFYNDNLSLKRRKSTFSKKLDFWLQKSPPPTISFTKEFTENDPGMESLLERISTFLAFNYKRSYVESSGEMMSIPYKSCNCSAPDCITCIGKIFPPFGINNIHTSNLIKVIKVKKDVFNAQIKPFTFNDNKLSFSKLSDFLKNSRQEPAVEIFEGVDNNASYASEILAQTTIETFNAAKVKLQISFDRILKQLDKPLKEVTLIKNTNMVRCIAKIYDHVYEKIIMFDKASAILEGVQIKHRKRYEST